MSSVTPVPCEPQSARGLRVIAALLSLLCPGAGHLWLGRPGLAFAVAASTALLLVPAAVWVWTLPVSRHGGLRAPAALMLLALPAADAFRRAAVRATPMPDSRAVRALLTTTLPLFLLVLLAFAFSNISYRWLAPMRLDRESMRPNLLPGDFLLMDIRPASVEDLAPGDLVFFEHPADSGRFHVKRMVATAGQELALRAGALVVDGESRLEPPVDGAEGASHERIGSRRYEVWTGEALAADYATQRVPAGTFFALGDDRAHSRDSRAFGPVPVTLLRGRPLRVLWSTDPGSGRLREDRTGHDPAMGPP